MIHCICGDGKGKTTAAVGLAVRFAGAGGRVCFVQFLKGSESCEVAMLERLGVTVLRNKKDMGFVFQMSDEQKAECAAMHNENLKKALEMLSGEENAMLVLDEVTYVYDMGLVDKALVEELIKNASDEREIVVTGRGPADIFLDNADYISEIRCVRHPYEKGVAARRGVEY